jgi:hypothetical protein
MHRHNQPKAQRASNSLFRKHEQKRLYRLYKIQTKQQNRPQKSQKGKNWFFKNLTMPADNRPTFIKPTKPSSTWQSPN